MAVAVLSSSISCSTTSIISLNHKHNRSKFSAFTLSLRFPLRPINLLHVCTPPHQEDSLSIDKSSLVVDETTAEDQLWAAARLRVRSFHQFDPDSFGVQVSPLSRIFLSFFLFFFKHESHFSYLFLFICFGLFFFFQKCKRRMRMERRRKKKKDNPTHLGIKSQPYRMCFYLIT